MEKPALRDPLRKEAVADALSRIDRVLDPDDLLPCANPLHRCPESLILSSIPLNKPNTDELPALRPRRQAPTGDLSGRAGGENDGIIGFDLLL